MLTFLIHRLDALLGHLYRISEFGESRCRVGRAMRRIQVPGAMTEPIDFLVCAIPVEPVAKVIASERVEEPLKPVTEPEQVTAQSVAAHVIPLPVLWQPPPCGRSNRPPTPSLL